jgi:hypothetical protein
MQHFGPYFTAADGVGFCQCEGPAAFSWDGDRETAWPVV